MLRVNFTETLNNLETMKETYTIFFKCINRLLVEFLLHQPTGEISPTDIFFILAESRLSFFRTTIF